MSWLLTGLYVWRANTEFATLNERIRPEKWLAGAKAVPDSWWTHWSHWLKAKAGNAITARRKLGSKRYPVIEAAPGRHVKERA